jgi:sulfur relay (sulfurtransferase) DsrC/TusE family protein
MFGKLLWYTIRTGPYSFCRASDDTSFWENSIFDHLLNSRYMQDTEVFQTFLIWWKLTLSCTLFMLSKKTIVRTGNKEFNHTVFIELIPAHPLEKNSRFYQLPKPRFMRHKNCYNIIDTRRHCKMHVMQNSSDFCFSLYYTYSDSPFHADSEYHLFSP